MRRSKQRTLKAAPTAAEVIAALQTFGATFRFSDCGSLYVCGLAQVPGTVVDNFMECDQREFVSAVRNLQPLSCPAVEASR